MKNTLSITIEYDKQPKAMSQKKKKKKKNKKKTNILKSQ